MKKSLENPGFKKYNHVRITDQGFIKGSMVIDDKAEGKIKNIILDII